MRRYWRGRWHRFNADKTWKAVNRKLLKDLSCSDDAGSRSLLTDTYPPLADDRCEWNRSRPQPFKVCVRIALWACDVAVERRRMEIREAPLSQRTVSASGSRLDLAVRSRNQANGLSVSISSVHRQRQFPPAQPGTFMRASRPRFNRSCNGAMASAARDDHAKPIKAGPGSIVRSFCSLKYFLDTDSC